MARTGTSTLVLTGLLLLAGPAAADPVTLAGGPSDRGATLAALEQARGRMGVCWQRKAPGTIKVALSVGKNGEVTKATAKTKGPAAQCAAGILAVSTLAPAGKAWKGTVAITPVSESKGQDVRAIHDQLALAGSRFFACQKKAPGWAGKVTLRVTVEQDGTIAGATGEASAKAGAPIGACVAAAAKALHLEPIGSPSVTYDLGLTFNGDDGGGGGGGGSAAADPSLQPSLKGPLEASGVAKVIAARRADLEKCARGSKGRGKVVVRVAIGADGKVGKAKIKSSEIDDAKVEGCLVKVFTKLTFATSTGETVVLYPVRLDADGLKTGS